MQTAQKILQDCQNTGFTKPKVIAMTITFLSFSTLAGILSYPKFVATHETIYAPNFTESEFAKITVGMTSEEVTKMLGDPLEIIPQKDGDHYVYSKSPNSTYYFEKDLIFKGGELVDIVDKLYID